MPIVIVEGCDRVGKTTFIENLILNVEGIKPTYIKFNVPPNDPKEARKFYQDKIDYVLEISRHELAVCDRSPISNLAYKGVYGGYVMSHRRMCELIDSLYGERPYMILLQDSEKRIRYRMEKEARETNDSLGLLSLQQIRSIQNFYVKYWKECRMRTREIYFLDSKETIEVAAKNLARRVNEKVVQNDRLLVN